MKSWPDYSEKARAFSREQGLKDSDIDVSPAKMNNPIERSSDEESNNFKYINIKTGYGYIFGFILYLFRQRVKHSN